MIIDNNRNVLLLIIIAIYAIMQKTELQREKKSFLLHHSVSQRCSAHRVLAVSHRCSLDARHFSTLLSRGAIFHSGALVHVVSQ